MQSTLLYLATVLIWGSSWLAITYQIGDVDALVSVAHRMLLATFFCGLITALKEGFASLNRGDHFRIFVQGLCLFSCNYLFIYAATVDLSSGLVAVVFSTMVLLNALGGAAFLGNKLSGAVIVGGVLGLFGMGLLFLPELETLSLEDPRLRALGLCFLGTLCASLGNMLAATNIKRGLPVLTCNSWGMLYGTITLYVAALVLGVTIELPMNTSYLGSLVYLSLFATVLAFWAYISLIGRIGPDRAAYSTLLFPIVALLISSVFESYQWSLYAVAGLALVLAGNWMAMRGVRA